MIWKRGGNVVINTTKKPFEKFSAMQRLALSGQKMLHYPLTTIEQFEDVYSKVSGIKKVIVERENFFLANDLINYCEFSVVTLDIERFADTGTTKFLLYECE